MADKEHQCATEIEMNETLTRRSSIGGSHPGEGDRDGERLGDHDAGREPRKGNHGDPRHFRVTVRIDLKIGGSSRNFQV